MEIDISLSEGLIALLLAFLSYRLGIRSERRDEELVREKQAVAYAAMDRILAAGKRLAITAPRDLAPESLEASRDALVDLSDLSVSLQKDVLSGFRTHGAYLLELAQAAEELANSSPQAGHAQAENEWFRTRFRTLYKVLAILATRALTRDEAKGKVVDLVKADWFEDPFWSHFDDGFHEFLGSAKTRSRVGHDQLL